MIYLGRRPLLIVSSAKAACEILKTHDLKFSNGPTPKTFNKLMYNSKDVAVAQYGECWRQMKSICVLQLLSNTRVRSFRSVREQEMILLMGKIEKSCSSVLDFSEMFMNLTKDVISIVALGRKYDGIEFGIDFKVLLKEF